MFVNVLNATSVRLFPPSPSPFVYVGVYACVAQTATVLLSDK